MRYLSVVLIGAVMALGGLAAAGQVFAEIYKWRDAEGRLRFSDTAPVTGEAHEAVAVTVNGSTGNHGDTPRPGGVKKAVRSPVRSASPPKKPAAKRIGLSDYELDTNIGFKADILSVRGRINRGPECKNLTLKFWLRNENGGTASVETAVQNAGGFGSTIYEASTKVRANRGGRDWVITRRLADCD